jgi:hypothetical protein
MRVVTQTASWPPSATIIDDAAGDSGLEHGHGTSQIKGTEMPGELPKLEFVLDDTKDGLRLTPGTVDFPTLRGFLVEVEQLIKGNAPAASLNDSRVWIEDGSVKVVVLVPHLLAEDVRGDLARLEATGDLDQIQQNRSNVIEHWQNRTRSAPTRTYSILREPGSAPFRVTRDTQLRHLGENSWVSVEKYLTGKVVNAGGKQDPNVHLVLSDTGETVKVGATEEQLGAEKENQLYKDVTLRVKGEQHLRTKALRNIRLIQFLGQSGEADEGVLANLWQNGREAWRGVPSPAVWVESLRGNH